MKEVKKERRVRVYLAMPEAKFRQIKVAAESAGITVSAWMTMAGNSYLARWRDPGARRAKQAQQDSKTHPSGWPKALPCYRCQQPKHDPAAHGESAQDVRVVLRMREASAVQAPEPEPPAYAPAGEGE